MTTDHNPGTLQLACRRDPASGERLTARHRPDCDTSGCPGCEPCWMAHCRCGRHLHTHEPLTCARCVGRTRADLDRIRDLCRLAPTAAAERVTSGGQLSAVLVLTGPVPEHATHRARHRWAYAGGLCRCASRGEVCPDDETLMGPTCRHGHVCGHFTCERINGRRCCPDLLAWLEYAEAGEESRHPLWVLGTWDMLVAEHLEHVRRARVTVTGAASYLSANLSDLAQDRDFAFDELAREIGQCRDHVERVMLVAARPQQGVPCPACRDAGRHARPLERRYREAGDGQAADARDVWVCGNRACDVELTVDEYARAVWVGYLGVADRLTAAQIRAQYRVPESTVRQWAVRGKVRRRGFDGQRRQLYDVGDVIAARD